MSDAETPVGITASLCAHARTRPSAIAMHGELESVTYAQLWQRAEYALQSLRAAGVQAGDRVAWLGLNDAAMLVLLLALARLGAILLPLNYRLAHAEHLAIVHDAQPCLLVADDTHRAAAEALCQVLGCRFCAAGVLSSSAASPACQTEPERPNDPQLLVYTSGTTGRPKGAVHTQLALAWNCAISRRVQQIDASDRVLTVLPLFHVGGLCI
ncbi:MAG: AMP-binding protein, partial [Burkholderiaceae bacterium]